MKQIVYFPLKKLNFCLQIVSGKVFCHFFLFWMNPMLVEMNFASEKMTSCLVTDNKERTSGCIMHLRIMEFVLHVPKNLCKAIIIFNFSNGEKIEHNFITKMLVLIR